MLGVAVCLPLQEVPVMASYFNDLGGLDYGVQRKGHSFGVRTIGNCSHLMSLHGRIFAGKPQLNSRITHKLQGLEGRPPILAPGGFRRSDLTEFLHDQIREEKDLCQRWQWISLAEDGFHFRLPQRSQVFTDSQVPVKNI